MSAPLNNLPLQLSSFIGRERESAEVKRLLATTRLLTLTGAGGCGKTALALRVCTDVLSERLYADGVYWVELAPLADPALVPQAVVKVLGIVEQPNRMLTDTLLDYLRDKELLLVLDNCEHLIEACAQLAILVLQGCPDLRIFATSREALNIAGEVAWMVPSLQLPTLQSPSSSLQQYDAIRLFVERAGAMDFHFNLTEQNANAVAEICQRLDGIPLAIELAAARVRVLSVEQIAARLDDALRLLTAGKHGAPQRHQTLRATMDWSYDLLSATEQILFCRLAVFAGGLTLDAAEHICTSEDLAPTDVLDGLMHLIDKSLLMKYEQAGAARYRMLEPIRQYALAQLTRAGELKPARERHLHFFAHWAERAEPQLYSHDELQWIELLEADHDNVRAAIEWSLASGDTDTGLRLAVAATNFWFMRGYWSEGLANLEALLARSEAATLLRAKGLFAAGYLAAALRGRAPAQARFSEGIQIARSLGSEGQPVLGTLLVYMARWPEPEDPVATRAWADEALAIGRALNSPGLIANSLIALAHAAALQADYLTARRLLEEARGVARTLTSARLLAIVGTNLGDLLVRHGEYAAARPYLAESLAIVRTSGPKRALAGAFYLLAIVEAREGNLAEAQTYSEESLALYQTLGNQREIANVLAVTADVARQRREFTKAYARLMESLQLWLKLPEEHGEAFTLELFGCLAAAQAQCEHAARLFGVAAARREQQSARASAFVAPGAPAGYTEAIAAVRAQVGAASFAKLLAQGRALTLEQALDEIEQERYRAQAAALRDLNALTARERDVLRLLAQGLSDAQIAEQLVISRRTVNTHLTTIYSKLGVNSRAAATRYALDHRLT